MIYRNNKMNSLFIEQKRYIPKIDQSSPFKIYHYRQSDFVYMPNDTQTIQAQYNASSQTAYINAYRNEDYRHEGLKIIYNRPSGGLNNFFQSNENNKTPFYHGNEPKTIKYLQIDGPVTRFVLGTSPDFLDWPNIEYIYLTGANQEVSLNNFSRTIRFFYAPNITKLIFTNQNIDMLVLNKNALGANYQNKKYNIEEAIIDSMPVYILRKK